MRLCLYKAFTFLLTTALAKPLGHPPADWYNAICEAGKPMVITSYVTITSINMVSPYPQAKAVVTSLDCKPDNCFLQLQRASDVVAPFCATWTSYPIWVMAGLINEVTSCVNTAELSSACSCVMTSPPSMTTAQAVALAEAPPVVIQAVTTVTITASQAPVITTNIMTPLQPVMSLATFPAASTFITAMSPTSIGTTLSIVTMTTQLHASEIVNSVSPDCSENACLNQIKDRFPIMAPFCAAYIKNSQITPPLTIPAQDLLCQGESEAISNACSCALKSHSGFTRPHHFPHFNYVPVKSDPTVRLLEQVSVTSTLANAVVIPAESTSKSLGTLTVTSIPTSVSTSSHETTAFISEQPTVISTPANSPAIFHEPATVSSMVEIPPYSRPAISSEEGKLPWSKGGPPFHHEHNLPGLTGVIDKVTKPLDDVPDK